MKLSCVLLIASFFTSCSTTNLVKQNNVSYPTLNSAIKSELFVSEAASRKLFALGEEEYKANDETLPKTAELVAETKIGGTPFYSYSEFVRKAEKEARAVGANIVYLYGVEGGDVGRDYYGGPTSITTVSKVTLQFRFYRFIK